MFLLVVHMSICMSVRGITLKVINGFTYKFHQMCISGQGTIDFGDYPDYDPDHLRYGSDHDRRLRICMKILPEGVLDQGSIH